MTKKTLDPKDPSEGPMIHPLKPGIDPQPLTPPEVETPDEKLKREQEERDIQKVSPEIPTNIGPDTTGVGQPTAQVVNQGQSLPPTAIPVERVFEGGNAKFYDPMQSEREVAKKEQANRGAKKTD